MIKTFEKELITEDLNTLKPLERVDIPDGGVALPDEVQQVVANRSGSILSASTILKSDFFSNLQKMSLPEWVPSALCRYVMPLTHIVADESMAPRTSGGSPFHYAWCPPLSHPQERMGPIGSTSLLETITNGCVGGA